MSSDARQRSGVPSPPNCGDHAVVVGGSVAGLLAARVLADAFERVTVFERDERPSDIAVRRGTPQGHHVHVLLEAGQNALDRLCPSYLQTLRDAGAQVVDGHRDLSVYSHGGRITEGAAEIPLYAASRPLFERVLCRAVADIDGVTVRDGSHVRDVLLDEAGQRVAGVAVEGAGTVSADLVVDASGRTSNTPTWLSRHGYERPPEESVEIDLAYSTVRLDRPTDEQRAVRVIASPTRPRGGALVPVEDDQWLLTLSGFHGDHPPTDLDGVADFCASLPVADLSETLDAATVRSETVHQFPFPANLRRRYWDLERVPEGLVVIGDAVASFNPVYGQGMTAASLQALELAATLAAGGREDVGRRFFDRIEPIVDDVWSLSVGADFRFPETTGPRPRGMGVFNRYVDRFTRRAHQDPQLADTYLRVFALTEGPAALLQPGTLWRVLKPAL